VDSTRGCETVRCTSTTHCVLGQCVPNNPPSPCKCGESCTMTTGSLGVCQVGGECAQNIMPPQCDEEDYPILCAMDVQTCPDGSFVSRKPPSCAFEQCPEEELKLCAMDIQTCPDGSFVSRKPPSCAFERCPEEEPKLCAMDIQTCPDGSTVGREGPNCAFKPCPKGSCPCGSPCTTPQNTNGFCQRNGHCKKKLPVCGRK
jgi:hypothetical protein